MTGLFRTLPRRPSDPPPPLTAGRAVALALVREAEENRALGRRLFMGRWRAPAEDAEARRQALRQTWRDSAEMALLWAGVALLGLALAGLAVLLA